MNGRYDGSSKFPKKDQWAFFPSASIGYRISEEAFWAPIKNTISNAKIRASYGMIGNQEVGDYMFLETMEKNRDYGKSSTKVNCWAAIICSLNSLVFPRWFLNP